jgi:cytochrome c
MQLLFIGSAVPSLRRNKPVPRRRGKLTNACRKYYKGAAASAHHTRPSRPRRARSFIREENTVKILLIAGLLSACLWPGASAAEPTEKDAVALVEKGARFMRAHGKDEMIKRINTRDPEFYLGALYLAMRDTSGITVAHPTTALIGKNLVDVPDADGKLFRREMIAVAKNKGGGWVDYKFMNPASGKVEPKTTYVLRVGDVALEAGIYKH